MNTAARRYAYIADRWRATEVHPIEALHADPRFRGARRADNRTVPVTGDYALTDLSASL